MEDQDKRKAQEAAENEQVQESVATSEGVDQAGAAAAPEADANELEARLAEAQAKAAELQDAFLRAKAETENLRRRAQDDVTKAHKFAIEGFAEALLPVRDSLEMALKVDTPSVDSLKEGVEMTLKQ